MFGDGYLVNKPRIHLVGYPIPKYVYDEFYKVLDDGKTLFVPIVVYESKPRIYLEKPLDETDAICRVFWKPEDIKRHVANLIKDTKTDGKIVGWEATPEAIVRSLISAGIKIPGLKIQAITTVFLGGEIRDLEVFWKNHNDLVI